MTVAGVACVPPALLRAREMNHRSWCLLLLVMGCAAPQPALVDQDVSFLVPLSAARSFLTASMPAGDGAVLVSRALFDRLEALTVTDEPDDLYAALSTVGVRLDPCFIEGVGAQACRPQVRLVLQPVFDSADGPTTRDAAIHVFFSATTEEIHAAVRALSMLRARAGVVVPEGLTGAHPGFEREAWVTDARALLLPLLRAERLVRATAMSVHASNQAWVFSGVEVSGGAFTEIVVPTLAPALEGHVTSTGALSAITITLDPPPVAEPTLPVVLKQEQRQQASAQELADAVAAVLRLEDPAVHNPGTVDCGSCHVAATAKWFLMNQAPVVAIASASPVSEVYADSRSLRAFGYFFQAPALSPRVQRETAAVRADLSLLLEP